MTLWCRPACCYKSCHLTDSAVISPSASGNTLYRETQHVGGSARTTVPLSHLPLIPDGAQSLYWGKIPFLWCMSKAKLLTRSRRLNCCLYKVNVSRAVTWHLFPSCFIKDNEASNGLYSLLSLDQKRESEDFILRRPLSKCNTKQWLYSLADYA